MKKVIVIGGGAAGMMAAIYASKNAEVHLFEHNEKLGKKLFITGKGRCNVTNNCDPEDLFKAVMSNPKFLYSAFAGFHSQDTMEFFENAGVRLKTERGNRVFPVSDHSSDIIQALKMTLNKNNVNIHLYSDIKRVIKEEYEKNEAEQKLKYHSRVTGVELSDGEIIEGDYVVIATGGLSYQTTGSTGDGYRFAEETGHKVTKTSPSLVPLITREDYIRELQGLSLRNVSLKIKNAKNKVLYDEFGEMMFTHFGITGPLVLSASAVIGRELEKRGELSGSIDLKPALTEEQLDARLLREFTAAQNKQLKNVIGVLYPASLTPVILALSGIDESKKIHDITKEERRRLIELTKAFPLTITGKGSYKEAIITRGGVSVKDVNPQNMESKYVKNLYFAGEVLDLDAVTGGYNLQIAWATAVLAGRNITDRIQNGLE